METCSCQNDVIEDFKEIVFHQSLWNLRRDTEGILNEVVFEF
jgi:hypothetical protein